MNHKTYDPALNPEREGKIYFAGVYEPNNPKHVSNNQASAGEPTNLYAMLYKISEQKKAEKKKTYTVTAKDPYPLIDWVKTRAPRPTKKMIEIERNAKQDLEEIKDRTLYTDLKTLEEK